MQQPTHRAAACAAAAATVEERGWSLRPVACRNPRAVRVQHVRGRVAMRPPASGARRMRVGIAARRRREGIERARSGETAHGARPQRAGQRLRR